MERIMSTRRPRSAAAKILLALFLFPVFLIVNWQEQMYNL